MGFFDEPIFDFNHDGIESPDETFIGLQMSATSRREAIDLTGDDTFYMGSDGLDDEEDEEDDESEKDEFDEDEDDYEGSGYSLDELEEMDADELEDLGFDADEF